MQKKILWFMCGLPGAGKTTAIRRYFKGYSIIHADDYPTELAFQLALINTVNNSRSIVIDGCYETKQAREQSIINILQHSTQDTVYEINVCVVLCAMDECKYRNLVRKRLDEKIVTTEDIDIKAKALTDPSNDDLPYSTLMYLDDFGNLLQIRPGKEFQ
jgi:predicted kinase